MGREARDCFVAGAWRNLAAAKSSPSRCPPNFSWEERVCLGRNTMEGEGHTE